MSVEQRSSVATRCAGKAQGQPLNSRRSRTCYPMAEQRRWGQIGACTQVSRVGVAKEFQEISKLEYRAIPANYVSGPFRLDVQGETLRCARPPCSGVATHAH